MRSDQHKAAFFFSSAGKRANRRSADPQFHMSGNPTNRELTFPSFRRFERLA